MRADTGVRPRRVRRLVPMAGVLLALTVGGLVTYGAEAAVVTPSATAARPGVVVDGDARFEVITPTLIRLEYAADGRFEDRPTLTVPRTPRAVPAFTSTVVDGWRVIRTDEVVLKWRRGSGSFEAADLRLQYLDKGTTKTVWPTAGAAHRFLGGWTRALDLSSGPVPLNKGILTREGWYVLDDSATALMTPEEPGFAVRPARSGAYQDWYTFAYGQDYARALADLRALTGTSPLLPRSAFGVWFSKYIAYSDAELRALAARFEAEGIPLDTLSLDTDFKRINDPVGSAIASTAVGQPGKAFSWNGWDWNTSLFPDPEGFTAWAERRGLNLLANIHPSISSNDPRFAQADEVAGGLPTDEGCRVIQADVTGTCHVFDWTDARDLEAYFGLHKTFADSGIDGFWLDWCCEAPGAVDAPGLSPDTWINQQYAEYQERRGSRWPAFSRIGASYVADGVYGDRGVGAGGTGALAEHRNTIQFTGDTCATWEMLAFQAELTAAEAAIGLPYVSHDIGSFNGTPFLGECQAVAAALTGSPVPDDLYVRWLQFGAFQPLDRLHSNHGKRLPWEYGLEARAAATQALRLRGSLVPYTYTAARRAVDTGLPIAGPLYLQWPGSAAAYQHPSQYTFGRDLVVAPVTSPASSDGLAAVKLWVPPGDWVEYSTGRRYAGPQTITTKVPLSRIPVLVRAGAVVPTQPLGVRTAAGPARRLVLTAYPGNRGTGELYDDAGTGFGYQRGELTRTTFTQVRDAGVTTLTIGRARGSFPGALTARSWDLRLRDLARPTAVTLNGKTVARATSVGAPGWSYDAATRTVRVVTSGLTTSAAAVVRVR